MDSKTDPPHGMDDVLRRMVAERQARIAVLEAGTAARDHSLTERNLAIAALEGQLAVAQAAIATRDTLIAAQARIIEDQTRHIEAQTQAIAAQNGHITGLEHQASILSRLATTLEWPHGPRALRAVLPAARLLRRLTGR